jgi:integrase/recombinase XerD
VRSGDFLPGTSTGRSALFFQLKGATMISQSQMNPAPAEWLQPHRAEFLQGLSDQGYARYTLSNYDRAIVYLCAAVEKRRLGVDDLVGTQVVRLRSIVLDGVRPRVRTNTAFCLDRFIDHLVKAGVATMPQPVQKVPTAFERLRSEYEAYLRDQRGLSEATIYHCLRFLDRFMTFRFGATLGNLDAIIPRDIVDFLRKIAGGGKPSRDKTAPSHLRNLFRFLFWSGKTKRDLANSIPRIAQPPQSHLPRHLKPEAVEKLIDAVWSGDPIGRRNYAMMLLIARLGLRAPEVIAVQLDDIDWRAGTILIRGKGKRHDRMPLSDDVGKAIVDYIRNGRRGPSRRLFVSNRVPYRPFVDAQILNVVLRAAFAQTGLKPPQKYVGSHLLRHSLATDLLRKGASLDEIGDVLRHRSRMSTTIYAKHDVEGLRSIARAWPVQGGRA